MLVLPVLLSVLVCYIIWQTILYIVWVMRTQSMTTNIPQIPYFISFMNFVRLQCLEDLFELVNRQCDEYMDKEDKIAKTWVGPKCYISIASAKHIEIVLSSHDAIQKDSGYEYFTLWGTGSFVSNGNRWAELRKPLNKILTKNLIESNLNVFFEKATILSQILSKFAENGDSVDMKHYVTNYSADTIAVTNFGHELNELQHDKWNLAENMDRAVEISMRLAIKIPYNLSFALAKCSKEGQQGSHYAEYIKGACCEMLDGRLATKRKLGETLDGEPKFYSDVILKVANRDNLNRDETGRLISDFFVGGFDTSSVIVATLLLMLAMYPEHDEAAYKEQIDLVGDDTSIPLTWEQISNMPCLTRMIKETLRLTNTPTIMRYATNDIDLGKYKIPKGSSINILLFQLHRHPSYWSHPKEFYPDHFLPEEVAARPKSAFYPFSWGPRSCPGKFYAMVSMKLVLSILIRNYKFETDLKFEDIKRKYGLLLEVAQGYHMRIKPRKTSSH